ncbi:MAG: glutathione S-transferase family protein [Candidatus Binatia bacterium]|nr:glutathione S-transferase family protein [Candidatus Binatia bacterium]
MEPVTLYGAPHSLYTGRVRSYLVKAGIAYRELVPNTQHFKERVLPKAGGRQSMPTLELVDGTVIRDGAAILDHFEAAGGHPFAPRSPRQRVLSLLFDVVGAEGLLRPAMHYRWNFDEMNLEFLRIHFQMLISTDVRAKADVFMQRMREAGIAFGVVPETYAVVESLYEGLLDKMDAHFADHPYLLGGKPCIGDFGMIAPLFAHLGRDPKPLALMQARAPHLYRWVERMNRLEDDRGEFGEAEEGGCLADDGIPDSVVEILRQLAIDFVPETKAAAQSINDWLAQQDSLAAGTEVMRGVGLAPFTVEGTTVNALAQPYRYYLLKRVQDEVAGLSEGARADVLELLERCEMAEVLDFRLTRGIGRENNLEVWL